MCRLNKKVFGNFGQPELQRQANGNCELHVQDFTGPTVGNYGGQMKTIKRIFSSELLQNPFHSYSVFLQMEAICSCEISVPTFLQSIKTKRTAPHLNV